MNIRSYIPSALLSPFIKNYLIIESEHELVNRILPGTSPVLSFRYKGKVAYVNDDTKEALPLSVISGLRRSRRLVNYANNTGNILVIFKEAGATAFIKEPLNELFEHSIPLNYVQGYKDAGDIEEQLAEANTDKERVGLLEQFLLSKLHQYKPDQIVTAALQKIHAANGNIKIKELTRSLYISQDAFEKRFRRIVGVPAKQFSYIIKMQAVISNGIKNLSLTDLAFDAGYFDQPHFNKDFKLFTGQSPTDFFKTPPSW